MMVADKMKAVIASLVVFSWLAGCAGSPLGNAVERSLEADPQLEESPPFEDTSESEQEDSRASEVATTEEDPELDGSSTPSSVNEDSAASLEREGLATTRPPEPGERAFIGPLRPNELALLATADQSSTETEDTPPSDERSNLDGVPADLQPYVEDLLALDLLTVNENDTTSSDSQSSDSQPEAGSAAFNQTATRREYARWLFAAHNALHANESGTRIRAGVTTDEPVFQDVPTTDPDFAAIQGLAAAGILPSALTGNSTAVTFQPDAPLAREDLILWKIPLDTRSALPTTSPEAVTGTWGFQDTASIEPLALRAVAADFQLGDLANIRRAFGYTTLFRPDKAVTRAEAAAVLWRFGTQTDGNSAARVLASREGEAE